MIKFTLIGDRVLVQLDKALDHTHTSSGIIIPLSQITETDGGKITTTTSSRKYLSQGTIVQCSPLAVSRLRESLSPLTDSDYTPPSRVLVSENAVNPHYQFFTDRSKLVSDFEGLIAIPHSLIEAFIDEEQA